MMPLPTSVAAGLELRLHQRDDVGARSQHGRHDRRMWRSEMNDTSMVTMSTRSRGRSASVRVPRVEVLDDDDARVVAQLPVELAVADVERDDARARRAAAGRR